MNNKHETAFLNEFNYFRGLAIIFIVWGHIISVLGVMPLLKKDNTLFTLLFRSFYANIWNGTALFVFISGFLFYHIFYQRGFDYPKFIKQKIRNVFCPYCVAVLVLFLMRVVSQTSMHKSGWLADPLGLIYKHCMFYSALWYIPFVMVLFLASPIFIRYIECGKNVQIGVWVLSVIIAMLVPRNNPNPIQGFIHWTPFYFLGIYCAMNYDWLQHINKYKKCLFFCIYCILIYYCAGHNHFISKSYAFKFDTLFKSWDLIVIHKSMLCIIGIWVLKWVADQNWPTVHNILDVFAKYSFSVFFFQNYVIFLIRRFGGSGSLTYLGLWKFSLAAFVITISACALCVALASVIKKLTGKYSRMLIGS